jgi:AraC-like DNA-binding protein
MSRTRLRRGNSGRGDHPFDAAAWFCCRDGPIGAPNCFSRRYLSAVFQRDVGLSPSRLQTILAFEVLYRDFARHGIARAMVDAALDRFHDQPHFTRVFRDLTGMPPARFASAGNDFGRLFYRD